MHKASKEATNEQKLGYAASKKQVANLIPKSKSEQLKNKPLEQDGAFKQVEEYKASKEETNSQKPGYAASKRQVANLIPESTSKKITKSFGNKMMLSSKWKGHA